jgi:hypothetical protein
MSHILTKTENTAVTVEVAALVVTMAMMYIALKFFLDIRIRKDILRPALEELRRLIQKGDKEGQLDKDAKEERSDGDASTTTSEGMNQAHCHLRHWSLNNN